MTVRRLLSLMTVALFSVDNIAAFYAGNSRGARVISTTGIRMAEVTPCPEISTTPQLSPQHDTCILALG